jgi:hypothetical protein
MHNIQSERYLISNLPIGARSSLTSKKRFLNTRLVANVQNRILEHFPGTGNRTWGEFFTEKMGNSDGSSER